MEITIYTDGACDIHAENKPGGWATILVATNDNGKPIKETVLSGGQEMTTNNQMELMAVIEGLKSLSKPTNVTVVSDSKYVINTVTKNFKINKVTAIAFYGDFSWTIVTISVAGISGFYV